MLNIARKAVLGLMALGVVAMTMAYGQNRINQFSPRQFNSQQTHYIRFVFNFNSCAMSSTFNGTCTLQVGALPYNAFVVRAFQQVVTSFNSGSLDSLSLGITSTSANELVAAQSVHSSGNGAALTILSPNLGVTATGNGATQTGSDGGFGLWAKYSSFGANATTGQAVLIVEYFAPNDGSCAPVPLNATAGAC